MWVHSGFPATRRPTQSHPGRRHHQRTSAPQQDDRRCHTRREACSKSLEKNTHTLLVYCAVYLTNKHEYTRSVQARMYPVPHNVFRNDTVVFRGRRAVSLPLLNFACENFPFSVCQLYRVGQKNCTRFSLHVQ